MHITNFEEEYSYGDIQRRCLSLSSIFNPFLTVKTIGTTINNRDIFMLKLGSADSSLILTGGVHGRESVNPVVLLRIAEEYCKYYFNSSLIEGIPARALFNKFSIIIIPVLNPDGYEIAKEQYDYKENSNGIDINRNFPSVHFRSTDKMIKPLSENESIALVDTFNAYPSIGYIDYHSRGNLIYYYRSSMDNNYNKNQKRIACMFRKITGYNLAKPEEEINPSDSGGFTVNYYSEHFHQPAFTIETVPDEASFPLDIKYYETVYKENLRVPGLYLRKVWNKK